jgi:heme-degrading monooxygenase HmoA
VIARMWRGAVDAADADEYASYVSRTGMSEYRSTPGNLAAYMLRRKRPTNATNGAQSRPLVEFVTFTVWESMDSVRAFAGGDPERAVFYPEDDRFLVDRDLTVAHFEVVEGPGHLQGPG